mmetsp:Transcript_19846/g.19172  ORF Transcript_19846/g.19172 Transcript_19846/m.19172 type:complete len:532 (-) Transcript_19846:143-1738(-)
MSKAFDLIVFGATGFTGRLVAKHIHNQNTNIRWAISGRSQSKLAALMAELVRMPSVKNLPDLLVADASDTTALYDMCGETKLVLNCTGPFRFLGKEVVEACLKAKCTYMDICGEPQFMEKCFLDYHDEAVKNNVLILHACAFDSVPADLGCLYTMRQYKPMKCSSIESFLTIDCPKGLKGHYTTYESAVHGMGDLQALKNVRKEINKKYKPSAITFPGPKITKVTSYAFEERLQKYVIPFMGSDASVVRSSQRTIAMRSNELIWPQYSACVTLSNMYTVAATSFYGSIFSVLSSNSWGRSLLLSYPEAFSDGIFSKDGPTQEQLDNTSFQMHFFSKGYTSNEVEDEDSEEEELESVLDPDSEKKRVRGRPVIKKAEVTGTSSSSKACSFNNIFKSEIISRLDVPLLDKAVHVVVSGQEPGYVATPAIFFALAQCVLEERDLMPKGGVLTPSSAFYDSPSVFKRLIAAGLNFQVVSDSQSMYGDEGMAKEVVGNTEVGEEIILKEEVANEVRINKIEQQDEALNSGVLIGKC